MSRVFEALEKASKESNKVVAKPGNGQPRREEPYAIPKTVAFEPNGTAAAATVPSRSWRMTMEELFFGRDLKKYRSYPIVALEKDSPAADQYKILREQVKRLRTEKAIRTLSVTSPIKHDGKSTVAVNLAAALALDSDERVLLIDGDLRQPQIHQYFGIQSGPGLSDILSSNSNGSIASYVKETFIPGLQVLTAGKSLALSSELLATEKMKTVMDEIRLKFPEHHIIIDSPPILSTADPLVLAEQVDGIIMVLRAGKTPRDCLAEAMDILKSNKIVGIVLNGAEHGMTSKYYHYERA
jgi:protein-tyrosine kinase